MEKKMQKITAYVQELLLFSSSFSLTGKNKKEELLSHAADSLLAFKTLKPLFEKENCTAADVGSGAGFPAVPLAIFFPSVHFTLIERMNKRCAFLANVKALLDLKNVTILNSDVKNVKQQFSLITFRAFSPLSEKLLQTLFTILKENGTIAAYKGKLKTIKEEISSLSYPCKIVDLMQNRSEEILSFFPKENEKKERHLLLFKKTS